MNLQKATKKLDKLTERNLLHCIQRAQDEIDAYKVVIENYPRDRLDKYGIPYMNELLKQKSVFEREIQRRKGL